MSHKLLPEVKDVPSKSKLKRFNIKMPNMTGKFGLSLFIGKREIFIGVSIGEVEIEQIIRRRLIKASRKGVVKVMQFD